MPSKTSFKILAFFLTLLVMVCPSAKTAARCFAKWQNGFHPGGRQWTDYCRVDIKKPLVTREGALSCRTLDGFYLASNALDNGWRYAGGGGISDPPGAKPGMITPPEYYGCILSHDGEAVETPQEVKPNILFSSIGYISFSSVRNR